MNSHPAAWSQIAELNRQEYHDKYLDNLASDEWKVLSRAVKDRDRHLCRACLKDKAVHVHHMTYAYGFFAPAMFLISLCAKCHSRMHRGWWGGNSQLPPANDNEPQTKLPLAAAE